MGMEPEDGSGFRQRPREIAAGDRLGRFEILGPLGAGGMGRVYRAHDARLRREVAIKVLPAAFWGDAERHRRFEREARAAASLNHPNVLAVHDFGIDDGIGFIVTELLVGETLRHRISGRPLPPSEAVEYVLQIAAGLAAGHERGIVHRDIKPENLFVTTDGRVKILDFGLAKITDPSSGDANSTATYDRAAARPVAGTAAYMAPEQARAESTDHRSDIFCTGIVLYEMLAGFNPFRRSGGGESLNAILHDEPPPLRGVAPELERVVRHCLEKTPERRFQNARDLMFALEGLPSAALTAPARFWGAHLLPGAIRWVVLGVLTVSVASVVGYFAGRRETRPERPAAIHRVDRLTDFAGIEESPAVAPDGRTVAFTASVNGRRHVFVRLLTGGSPMQITRDDADHQLPRWSPDGDSLFYFSAGGPDRAEGEIWRISALGGSPRRVIASLGGADISRDGRLALFRLINGHVQLLTCSLEGNEIRPVIELGPGYHLYPRWSPDGRVIAYQRGDGVRSDIFVVSANGGEPRRLTREKNIIRGLSWLPDGSGVVYASSRGSTLAYLPPLALWRIPRQGGLPRQITPRDAWYEQPDLHRTGLLSAARMLMRFDLWRFPFGPVASENVRLAERLTRQTGHVLTPTAAPDGEHIAFLSDSGGHGNISVLSTRTGLQRQVTFEDDPDTNVGVPVWSPDGRSIAFVSSRGNTGLEFGIWLVDPDGRNLRNLVRRGLGFAWSSDGQWLYYVETAGGAIRKVRTSGGSPMTVRSGATRNVIAAHGSALYYTIEHVLVDGRPEVEIVAANPENGPSRVLGRIAASRIAPWQIVNPSLSPDGQWLAMPLTDGFTTNVWALSTRDGSWRQVTDFGDRATFIARRVSWAADGRSILAAVGEGDTDIVMLSGLIGQEAANH